MIKDFSEYTKKGKFHFANMKDTDFMQHPVYSGLKYSFILKTDFFENCIN